MKVLKIAAIAIGAVALVATGIGLVAGAPGLMSAFGFGMSTLGIAGAAASVGIGMSTLAAISLGALAITASSAFAPKPPSGGSQTKWKADPYAGIPYVVGRTKVGGNIVFRKGHGGANNPYQTIVTVLSLGPIKSIQQTIMNGAVMAFTVSGAATGAFAGQVWQDTQLGACPESTALVSPVGNPPQWTAQHKISGLAARLNTFKFDTKSKQQLTAVPDSASVIEGVFVYDPRLDSTYPGGSGPCRAFQEETYVWSEDPHLHALTWALGRWQNGVRVAGIGLGDHVPDGTVRGVDIASFVEGANLNDARGWKCGGEVRTRPDTPWNVLKLMLQAGGARPQLVGGVITAINRAPRVSLATIGPDDIVGECSFAGTARRRSRINSAIPSYRSEGHNWEFIPAAEIAVPEFIAMDGGPRSKEMPFYLVQNVNQAAQLAVYEIYDQREAGPGTVQLKPWWFNFRPGDCVTFAPEPGWSIKTVIETRTPDLQNATVSYGLRGETDAKHPYALARTGGAPPVESYAWSNGVAAPDANDWTASGETLSANGASIPAIVLSGACGNTSAEAVVIDYRPVISGQGVDDNWSSASLDPPTLTRKEITSVTPGTDYEIGVRYRVRGVLGDRRIVGPATAGQFSVARAAHSVVSIIGGGWPVTSDDSTISIAGFTAVVDDGRTVSFAAATLTGLNPGTAYHLFYQGGSTPWIAVAGDGAVQMANAALIRLGQQWTSSSGTYPTPDPPPPGYGGGYSGGEWIQYQ